MLKNTHAHLTLLRQTNYPSEKRRIWLENNIFKKETKSQADFIFHACANAIFEQL